MPAPGSRLGRFELIAPLGGGGMGSVWRARDSSLNRDVALKVIAPTLENQRDALARFRREAETASALNHPALVTVFEIGIAPEEGNAVFIAMQLVEGCNLRDWLAARRPLTEVLDVLAQAAAGLAAAHEQGVLHRDVKPENIMVTPDGFAKIVDFGLAKFVAQPGPLSGNEVTAEKITRSDVMVGTIPYMSPEQVCGEELDARSDIFSLGAVLHEAVTGRRLFAGKNNADVIRQILHDEIAPPPGLDPAVASILAGCLQKDRELRIGSMREVAGRLRAAVRVMPQQAAVTRRRRTAQTIIAGLAAAAIVLVVAAALMLPRLRSRPDAGSATVAVLAFDTPSGADTYISSGIADGVTTDLAKLSGLAVIARESATRFRSAADLRQISADLGARYLLLGNVTRMGEKLRIDARLVEGSSRAVLWAQNYDATLGDIFSVQSRIARDVATNLVPRNAPVAPDTTPHDPAVADLYFRARFFASDREWPVQDKSIPLLEKVCAADPQFTPARIELAQQYARRAFSRDPDRRWEELAYVEIEKLLRDFPDESEPYRIRGNLRYTMGGGWRYDEALADYDRSLSIDGNNAEAYASRASLLMHIGLLEEALADYRRALQLDPFNESSRYRVPRVLMYQQKHAQAIEGWRSHGHRGFELAVALDIVGDHDGARRVMDDGTTRDHADVASALAVLEARRGDRAAAERQIRRAMEGEGSSHFHHAAYFVAAAHAQMSNVAEAVEWLEKVRTDGMPCHPLFADDALLDPIRDSPAFRSFLERSRVDWERRRAARIRPPA